MLRADFLYGQELVYISCWAMLPSRTDDCHFMGLCHGHRYKISLARSSRTSYPLPPPSCWPEQIKQLILQKDMNISYKVMGNHATDHPPGLSPRPSLTMTLWGSRASSRSHLFFWTTNGPEGSRDTALIIVGGITNYNEKLNYKETYRQVLRKCKKDPKSEKRNVIQSLSTKLRS